MFGPAPWHSRVLSLLDALCQRLNSLVQPMSRAPRPVQVAREKELPVTSVARICRKSEMPPPPKRPHDVAARTADVFHTTSSDSRRHVGTVLVLTRFQPRRSAPFRSGTGRCYSGIGSAHPPRRTTVAPDNAGVRPASPSRGALSVRPFTLTSDIRPTRRR